MQHTESNNGVSSSIARAARSRYEAGSVTLTERVCKSNGIALNLAVGPRSGPPLLLLHGVTRTWQDFRNLIPRLSERWQVFAPDFRGHGRSGRSPRRYRVADYIKDTAALLENEIPGAPAIFGHSLGALVAAALAARFPARVRAVVLEDPPFSALGSQIAQTPFHLQFVGMRALVGQGLALPELERQLASLPTIRVRDGARVQLSELRDPASIRFSAECLTNLDPAVLDPLVDGDWMDGTSGADWRRIECPALLLKGETTAGAMLTEVEAAEVARALPACRREDFPGVGHLIHESQPDRTLELLTAFLGGNHQTHYQETNP